ncbi:MAG: YraN family protein [Acidobacteria bacterium]|nr:YraN family protein [Acidobacteriota bacterium]
MKRKAKTELSPHLILGRRGEQFALEYLKQRQGYRIVAQNFSIPLGRNLRGAPVVGEIDIIGYDGETLAFIEVKTRTSEEMATAAAALDRAKQRTISRTARAYRRLLRLDDINFRFDLVAVVFGDEASPTITLHKGYFTERAVKPAREIW